MKNVGLHLVVLFVVVMLLVSPGVQAEQPKSASVAKTVSVELRDVPVAKAIDILFQGTGYRYSLQPGVTGKVVELKLHDITFEQALAAFTEAAELKYTIKDGVYTIGPAVATASGSGPAGSVVIEPKQEAPEAQVVYPQENNYVNGEDVAAAPIVQQPTTQVIVNQESPSPIFYGQPAMGGYPDYGAPYYGAPYYQFGNVAILGNGGYPVVIAGRPSLYWRRVHAPPPPPGYVSADVLRFLRGQAAIESRTIVTPIY